MSELGIFIDESGFIETDNSSNVNIRDLYIVSFVFHNKSMLINEDVKTFEDFLAESGFERNLPIHTMPLIRQQKPYKYLNSDMRKKLFYHLYQFMLRLKLQINT